MQERYRIYQRGGKNFYAKDTKTGRAFSLNTSDEREAAHLLVAKNQATESSPASTWQWLTLRYICSLYRQSLFFN